MDLLPFCDFTNYFFLSLWIHHLILKIHYLFVNIQRIHDLFRGFTMKLLYFPWIHYIFTIYFANLLWIHYRLGEFTTDPVSGPWIHYLLHKFTMNSPSFTRIHYNFLCLLRIKYKFTWCFTMNYLFCEFKINSISFSRITDKTNVNRRFNAHVKLFLLPLCHH